MRRRNTIILFVLIHCSLASQAICRADNQTALFERLFGSYLEYLKKNDVESAFKMTDLALYVEEDELKQSAIGFQCIARTTQRLLGDFRISSTKSVKKVDPSKHADVFGDFDDVVYVTIEMMEMNEKTECQWKVSVIVVTLAFKSYENKWFLSPFPRIEVTF